MKALAIIFILVFGLSAFSYSVGVVIGKSDALKVCIEQPRKQMSYPKTKKEMAEYIQFHSNGG